MPCLPVVGAEVGRCATAGSPSRVFGGKAGTVGQANRGTAVVHGLLFVLALLVAGCTAARTDHAAHASPPQHVDLLNRIDVALGRASGFLVGTQSPDGAFRSTVYGPYRDGPTLTPYVLTALHLVGRDPAAEASFARGRRYVWNLVRAPDDPVLANPAYTAAPATWVIGTGVQTSDSVVARKRWLDYLREFQLNAVNGWSPDDPEFGGWGYSHVVPRKPAPAEARPPGLGANLSATVYALGALRMEGVPPTDPVYAEILAFVSRCQNFADDPARGDPAFDDGGFFFTPGDAARNKAGVAGTDRLGRARFHSYGGMTADGLRALLHAGLPPDHPRVVAARRWLERRFRPDTNPGVFEPDREVLRDATYYYYCWSVAHAFAHLRVRGIETEAGTVDWPVALAEALLARQQPDGAWRNRFTDTREDDPLVATPAAAAALQICRMLIAGEMPVSHRTR
jgi:squalene-hopene/tetraprenyl-beta-curcumene cyclase